jgi:hypothetical protein
MHLFCRLSDTIASREKVKEELCYLKTITFGVAASQADDISFAIDSGKRAIVVKFKSVSVRGRASETLF